MRPIIAAMVLLLAGAVARAEQTVTLTSGEVLKGTIVERTDEALVLDHPLLGRLTIAAANVQDPPPAPPASQPAVDAPAESTSPLGTTAALAETAAAEPVPLPPWLQDWKHRIEAGLTGTEGNNDTLNMRLAYRAQRETERDRTKFDTTYFMARDDTGTTNNELVLRFEHDWLLTESNWFPFVRFQYDFDDFESWKHRVQGFAGMGYTVVKSDDLEANFRFGGGFAKEFSGRRDLRPEGLFSVGVVKWHPTPHQTVAGSLTYHPDLGDPGEFRLIGALEYQIKIPDLEGLSVKFGLDNEYESDPGPGDEKNDLRYFATLVYEF